MNASTQPLERPARDPLRSAAELLLELVGHHAWVARPRNGSPLSIAGDVPDALLLRAIDASPDLKTLSDAGWWAYPCYHPCRVCGKKQRWPVLLRQLDRECGGGPRAPKEDPTMTDTYKRLARLAQEADRERDPAGEPLPWAVTRSYCAPSAGYCVWVGHTPFFRPTLREAVDAALAEIGRRRPAIYRTGPWQQAPLWARGDA